MLKSILEKCVLTLLNRKCNACWQIAKLHSSLASLETANVRAVVPPTPPHVAMLVSMGVAVARAVAAASGALALLYCAVALPGIRNTLYNTLAAEPGALRLPVLTVLAVIAFVAASVSNAADQFLAGTRA